MRRNLTATIFVLIYILNIFIKNHETLYFKNMARTLIFSLSNIQISVVKKIHKWAQIDNGFSN